ncbi:MAG TPA: hypothetical protein VHM65_02820 [Candidatus Lustribacter sp.]|nr:hypothetical protein [Candidatus Lustribacter sp.]
MMTSTPSYEHRVANATGPSDGPDDGLTVAQLRRLLPQLPSQARVVIGVRDDHHFDVLLGELPVLSASAVNGPARCALVLQVDGLS